MKNLFLLILLQLTFCLKMQGQYLSEEEARSFINGLLTNSLSGNDIVKKDEQEISKRLGITYDEVEDKFFIAYNIDKQLRKPILNAVYDYSIKTQNIVPDITILNFNVPAVEFSRNFYFENKKLISPISYHTRNLKTIDTKYFRIKISSPSLFNQYSADYLDTFTEKMLSLLNFSSQEKEKLSNEKIYYVFCKDEDEIYRFTGFKTIGIYNLACDYIVSTYNCHIHEVCHLLINYKLKTVPLFTHPFMQEGFAVGFGGRGGRNPQVIRKVGEYLLKSGVMELSSLFTKDGFFAEDASMTYPVVGFYCRHLINTIGIEKYLELYKTFSSGESDIENVKIDLKNLPPYTDFSEPEVIKFPEETSETQTGDYEYKVYDFGENYLFSMKDTLLISTGDCEPEYQSKKFEEMVKARKYNGEKYLLIANENEILIYNLYTNILIANYVNSFQIPPVNVYRRKDLFEFLVPKPCFDEDLVSKGIILKN